MEKGPNPEGLTEEDIRDIEMLYPVFKFMEDNDFEPSEMRLAYLLSLGVDVKNDLPLKPLKRFNPLKSLLIWMASKRLKKVFDEGVTLNKAINYILAEEHAFFLNKRYTSIVNSMDITEKEKDILFSVANDNVRCILNIMDYDSRHIRRVHVRHDGEDRHSNRIMFLSHMVKILDEIKDHKLKIYISNS